MNNNNLNRVYQVSKPIIEALSTIGTGAISLSGDPISSAAGSIAIQSLKNIAFDFIDRKLSSRESFRIAKLCIEVDRLIQEKLNNGESLRMDGFFDQDDFNWSKSDEIIEAAFLKVKQEPNEKKIPYIGNLLGNIIFDDSVSADTGHYIFESIEKLSYRQFCILRMVIEKDRSSFNLNLLRPKDNISDVSNTFHETMHECLDLTIKGYIDHSGVLSSGDGRNQYNKFIYPQLGMATIFPIAKRIYKLCRLDQIPDEDLKSIYNIIKSGSRVISV